MDNVLIILTSTVNINQYKNYLHQKDPGERLNCYIKSIKQWLEQTNLKICLVENSGYTFPELKEYQEKHSNRFEIITFNEFENPPESQHLIYNSSKGASEMYAIIYAYNNTKFKDSINFIIKITCRYFIPSFEQFLIEKGILYKTRGVGIHDYRQMVIGLRQNNHQRCEILGIHSKFFNMLFELSLSDESGAFFPHVEHVYCNRLKLLNESKIINCPPFVIEPTPMGGVDVIVTEL
jgi:hypothetical protein